MNIFRFKKRANIQPEKNGFLVRDVSANTGRTFLDLRQKAKMVRESVPIIEVHLSNIFKREEHRKISYTLESSTGIIAGFGSLSYTNALNLLIELIRTQ